MLQTRTCVAPHCDQCGATPSTDEYEPHWPTEDDALEVADAAQWYVEDLPRLLCSGCHAVLSCEGTGHEFTGWRRCRCEQRVPAHPPGPDGVCGTQFRCCLRCSMHESRPTPEGEASEQTATRDLPVDDARASYALTDSGHAALAATQCPRPREPVHLARHDRRRARRGGGPMIAPRPSMTTWRPCSPTFPPVTEPTTGGAR